jgi:hypothetical protein
VVLLGLIALGSLVQTIFLIGMARQGLLVAKRLKEIQQSYEQQLEPALAQVARIQHDVAVLSELFGRQQERLQEFMQRTSEKVEAARETIGPLTKVLAVAAMVRGAGKGLRLLRKVRRFF